MAQPLTAKYTFWRRLVVEALTAVAALALAFAAVNGATDALHQVLFAALLLATGAIMEPRPMVLRRSERHPRPSLRSQRPA